MPFRCHVLNNATLVIRSKFHVSSFVAADFVVVGGRKYRQNLQQKEQRVGHRMTSLCFVLSVQKNLSVNDRSLPQRKGLPGRRVCTRNLQAYTHATVSTRSGCACAESWPWCQDRSSCLRHETYSACILESPWDHSTGCPRSKHSKTGEKSLFKSLKTRPQRRGRGSNSNQKNNNDDTNRTHHLHLKSKTALQHNKNGNASLPVSTLSDPRGGPLIRPFCLHPLHPPMLVASMPTNTKTTNKTKNILQRQWNITSPL